MTTGWHFQPLAPGYTVREPIAGAFFASDAVSEPGEALVREGIQNSLDAALPGVKTLVRISLVTENEGSDRREVSPYFAGTAAHYEADRNGLRKEDLPGENEACTLLIFEDFGTSGLQGDPAAPYPPEQHDENNFFHFFRAEGLSDKDPGKRGSWGLGKDTFFRASRINTVFGLTVRSDDGRRLLMGKTVLKSHWVDGIRCQDGYFGARAENENMVLPIESPDAVEQFQQVFQLYRKSDSGLSIVVPWFDLEVTEHALLQAVVKNCSYAILSGDLDVIIETAGIEPTWIEKDNLIAEAQKFSEQADMLPAIELSQWALSEESADGRHTLAMTAPTRRWSWDKSLFGNDLLKVLDGKLKAQERISIRVPVTVRKRDGASAVSHFDLYMVNENSSQRLRPVFIRDGIVISDVRAPYLRGIRALVVVDDAPLSEFLRQAENPSHTVWQEQQVKKDYRSGVGDLRFVVQSVRRICDLVAAEDKEEDRRLLADIFPVPGAGNNGDRASPPPPTPPPSRPSRFTIRPAQGGFSVAPGVAPIPAGSHAEISVAYDVRRGSATAQYRTTDFQLSMPPIQYQCEGAEVITTDNNRMVVRITEPDDFRLTVAGFDPNRQIYVDVKESGDA